MLREADEENLGHNLVEENEFEEALHWCSELLLKQGPLEYFVHHNTLHAFESESFFEGLRLAENLYQADTRMPLGWYQDQHKSGRINQEDLEESIFKVLGNNFPFKMFINFNEDVTVDKNPLRDEFLQRQNLLKSEGYKDYFQVTSFWDHCEDELVKEEIKTKITHAKSKFLSAFFDKGTSYWAMEEREKGLKYSFGQFLAYLPNNEYNNLLNKSFLELSKNDSIIEGLKHFFESLNIPKKYYKNYLFTLLHQSKGWSALVYSLAENPDFNPTKIKVAIDDYILLVLTFELATYQYLSKKNLLSSVFYESKLREEKDETYVKALYDYLIKEKMSDLEVQELFIKEHHSLLKIQEYNLFRVWQEAYELNLIKRLLQCHKKCSEEVSSERPWLQVVTCIDDREESTRRYYEEFSTGVETFGYAGHFGLNMKYRSIKDAHFRALCPLGATAENYVFEEVLPDQNFDLKSIAKLKKFLLHSAHFPLMGSLLSFILGPITLMLFLFETLAPKNVHRLRKFLKGLMFPAVKTRLNFLDAEDRAFHGFSYDQLANAGASLLKTTGLINNLAPLVFLCGHGSKSMNNPHGAAYNCGACAGGKGAPNARLMAQVLNDSQIRMRLRQMNIVIPDDTLFVGGYHCTSTDKILVLSEEGIEGQQLLRLNEVNNFVEKLDAKERMRKFENVPLNVNEDVALMMAQNRSYDFSQPRPEYGHNTNAFCLVGKRSRNKKMFLDRRAFLVSYDDKLDKDNSIINSLLGAVIPVCAGINLEYYFSYVDPERFGAGVKQAHNVTSLMGVMNGYRSDLRLGLPWQMVEIHEPSRIIFIIECSIESFEKVLNQNHHVKNLVVNEWVLIFLNPKEGEYFRYSSAGADSWDDRIEKVNIPVRKSSHDCFEGERELVPLALIDDLILKGGKENE